MRPVLMLVAVAALSACNGVFGLDDVGIRGTGGGSGDGGSTGVTGTTGTMVTGTTGTGGATVTSSTGQGGGPTGLCGELPSDNLVVDGGFENVTVDWWGPNGYLEAKTFAAVSEPSCEGDTFCYFEDYGSASYAWGTGTHSPLLAASTECIEWSFSARAHDPDLYVTVTLAFEGTPYTVNEITGSAGILVQGPVWEYHEGACRLTLPNFINKLNIFFGFSQAGPPDKRGDMDALVVRPIPCGPTVTPCLFTQS